MLFLFLRGSGSFSHGWASHCSVLFFLWSTSIAFRRVALETSEWTSRDSNHHRQSVSAGKTNAIPTEPSGRLHCSVLFWSLDALFVFGLPSFAPLDPFRLCKDKPVLRPGESQEGEGRRKKMRSLAGVGRSRYTC